MNGCTQIVNAEKEHFSIARNLKESVKARFEPEAWQRVAKPIFDRLRQKQRDALVTYVLHKEHFDRIEQLYEYFLIDPGMEPVVQTSRIRLAIASVQLFVQRCLLNLEEHVKPSDINAEQWEWMKRYRVWEANRKIFLFPENWLEPEFRDDKSHLFTELEGTLLQGDVSSDLVEDALLTYLRKLDELARLDIVAMHCEYDEEDVIRSKATLHVFGRTFGGEPHKYFYRRYDGGEWSPWEPMSVEIESDHLAPVVWRDRLYLFWVTFMDKPDEAAAPGNLPENQTIADANLVDITTALKNVSKTKKVEVQLHWSEYIKGEWSVQESSGYGGGDETDNSKMIATVSSIFFTPQSVRISVTVPKDENGEEIGVYVNLDSKNNFGSKSFYLAGRNSTPEQQTTISLQLNPYRSTTQYNYPTKFSGSGALKVSFDETLRSES